MQFSSYNRGALLTAAQAFAIGLILCMGVSLFSVAISLIVLAIWGFACLWLFLRMCCVRVFTRHGILHVEKGRLFPYSIRMPIRHITGVQIIRTPLAKLIGSCWCIVHTSGFSFILLGIRHTDALLLADLIIHEEI